MEQRHQYVVQGIVLEVQIIDSQIEALNRLQDAYREGLSEIGKVVNELRAVCKVCGRLNTLVGNRKANNKQGPEDDKAAIEKLTDWY